MKLDIKKLLLAGTAIVAIGAAPLVISPAHAADEFSVDADANGTFDADELASTAFDWGAVTDGTAAAGEATDSFDLQVNASGTITIENGDTIGNGDATVAAIVAGADAQTLTIDDNANDDAFESVTIDGDISVGAFTAFNLTVTGEDTDATGDDFDLDVNGNVNLGTGTLTIVADAANANNDVSFLLSGNLTAGSVVLTDGASDAVLLLDGTTAQTVNATIDGSGAGLGFVGVTNAAGVTFTGDIGTTTNTVNSINVGLDGTAGVSATFRGDVATANGIIIGDVETATTVDTVTVTFDSQDGAQAITGVVDANATDTANVVVTGGNTVTANNNWGAGNALGTVSVTTTGTTLDLDGTLDATTLTSATGTTIDVGAGDVTAAVTNAGTLIMSGAGNVVGDIANTGTIQQTGTGGITGDVSGAGTIDVDADLTVTGDLGATSADVATGTTLTVAGGVGNDIAVTTTTLNGTASLDFTGGSNLTGNVVAAADGDGAVNILDAGATTAIVGNIGSSTAAIATLDVAGGSGDIVTTTGDLWVNAITVNDADILSFIGSSAQAVSGTITDGTLNVGNGTTATDVTFNGVISSAVTQNVQAAATATYAANATFTGAYTNAGTTVVGTGATLTAGSLTDSGGTFVLNLSDADNMLTTADIGLVDLGGAATLDTDDLSVNVTGTVGTGTVDVLTNAGDALDEAKEITDNSALYTFTAATDGTLTVAVADTSSLTSSSAQTATADEILGVTATGELLQVQNALVSSGDSATFSDTAEAAASDVSGGAVVAGVQVATSTTTINNQRLAALRSGDTGMNAGQVMQGLKTWVQGFGQSATQDERDGVSGYDADTFGIAAGIDTENLGNDVTLGLSVAYAQTDVESDSISNAETEVDSYQISLYGDYDVTDTVFVTGQLGYIWAENDTTRNPGGISSLTASGDYDSDTIIANVAVGRDYLTGHGSLVVTPTVSANYMRYSADEYTETGAGTANLIVDAEDLDLFELGLSVDAKWTLKQNNGSVFKPAIGVGVRHDLIGDEFESTNQFTGGGSAFKVEGFDPAETTFDAGFGFDFETTSNWVFSADYNFEYKSDYDAHSGLVKAAYKF